MKNAARQTTQKKVKVGDSVAVKMTASGHVTLPPGVCEFLGVEPGLMLLVESRPGGRIIVRRKP